MTGTPSRLLVVSNRLPLTVSRTRGPLELHDSCGGLATGLRASHEAGNGLWIGWPGEPARAETLRDRELESLLASHRLVPVHLSAPDVREYYEGFSNGVIWPLFHYLLDRVPLDADGWPRYRAVNERFADVVASRWQPGDTIWVHDYHLMLLPALLRRRLPASRIGFFLHIPFPSSELFRVLPWRRDLLEGLLGADLIGFHTEAYVQHFAAALRQVEGLQTGPDRVVYAGREVRFGQFPMGIDAAAFEALAADPAVRAEASAIRHAAQGCVVLLGIDRLDYTKGIPRRLLAFERLLDRDPDRRGRVRLIQVAVPSRAGTEPYKAFRRQVEELVGRINGRFGTVGAAPVHYLFQSFTREQLAAMYRAANVMLVTPLRDGMNLVAKEFVASRIDEDGVLVLSEFAGAAAELQEAVLVNPYDVDGMVDGLRQALDMTQAERRTRMRALRNRVARGAVDRWEQAFLGAMATPRPAAPKVEIASGNDITTLTTRCRGSGRMVLLLDYDGTLVPLAPAPDLAEPDAELLQLLATLGRREDSAAHIVSGRPAAELDRWLCGLGLQLWAEHGLWRRVGRRATWTICNGAGAEWMGTARSILERFTTSTPGSFVETKSRSLAWHYRMSDPDLGGEQARQLRRALAAALRDEPVEVLSGHKVIEVRPRGVNKGEVVRRIVSEHGAAPTILAVGDDQTDEDMFGALPASGVAVRVGPGPSQARFRLPDPMAVRALIRSLVA